MRGSHHGLVNESAGLVTNFRVRIRERSLVVLGRACLFYVRNPCSVASIVGDLFDAPKEKKPDIGSSPGNKTEIKVGGC